MLSSNEANGDSKLDIKNFRLYVFQPTMSYYYSPFIERLSILTTYISFADSTFNNESLPDSAKALFVAPEYLFKDFSKAGAKRYYSHQEKKAYVATLEQLSTKTNLIIAPGTICWKNEIIANKSHHQTFRNTAYLFFHGQREKYKKSNLAAADCDVSSHNMTVTSLAFKTGNQENPIKSINGLQIGIEICLDHGRLTTYCDEHKINYTELNIHLVLANNLATFKTPKKSGPLVIKIDHRPGYSEHASNHQNEIGIVKPNPINQRRCLLPAKCETETDDLFGYRFNESWNSCEYRYIENLPGSCRLSQSEFITHTRDRIRDCLEGLDESLIIRFHRLIKRDITHQHSIDIDFPNHVRRLKDAELLNDSNASVLFYNPSKAFEYSKALIDAKNEGFLTPEVNVLLNENITHIYELKKLLSLLNQHKYLDLAIIRFFTNALETLRQLTRGQIEQTIARFTPLIQLGRFDTMYIYDMFKDMRSFNHYTVALKCIIQLLNIGITFDFTALTLHLKSHHGYIDRIQDAMVDIYSLYAESQPSLTPKQKQLCKTLMRLICGAKDVFLSEHNKLEIARSVLGDSFLNKHDDTLKVLNINITLEKTADQANQPHHLRQKSV